MLRTLTVLLTLVAVSAAHMIRTSTPERALKATGGAHCTHYLVDNHCENPSIQGGHLLQCETIQIKVHWYWCFYNLTTYQPVPTNCDQHEPFGLGIPCKSKVYTETPPGGCTENIACIPI